MKTPNHKYQMDAVCVYTNRGSSGYTGNDGKRCRITRLKPPEEWAQGEPEYVMQFLKRNDQIVALHDRDTIKYSFTNLAKRFLNSKTGKGLSRSTIHEIYVREKARLGDKKALASRVVRKKYPALVLGRKAAL